MLPPVHSSYTWGTDGTPLHQASGHWPGLVCDLLSLFLFLQPALARRSVKLSQAEKETASIWEGSGRQRKRQGLSLTGNKKWGGKNGRKSRVYLVKREQKKSRITPEVQLEREGEHLRSSTAPSHDSTRLMQGEGWVVPRVQQDTQQKTEMSRHSS